MVDRFFCNCRGLNYVAVYPDFWENPPADLGTFSYEASVGGIPIGSINIPEVYHGTTNPISMWRWYTSSAVDIQFGYLKSIGVNCVRVWLSYFVWHEATKNITLPTDTNQFLANLEDFAELANKYRLRVIWVLWDDFGGSVSYQYPYTSTQAGWVAQPGHLLDNTDFIVDGSSFTYTIAGSVTTDVSFSPGRDYIEDVVNTVKDYQCTLMYDMVNEPLDETMVNFSISSAALVRGFDTDTSHKVTVGFAGARPYDRFVSAIANSPNVDIISFHPYNVTKQSFDEAVRLAEILSEQILDEEKPIFASEGGSPGIYMRYERFMDFCRNQKLGFVSFGAMIDDPQSGFPVKGKSGYFFHDGEIRDQLAVDKFINLGREDGIIPTFYSTFPTLKETYTDADSDTTPEDFTPYDSELISAGTGSEKLANLSYYTWTGQKILDDIVSRADWTLLNSLTTDVARLKEYLRQVTKLTVITNDLVIFYESTLGIRSSPYASHFLSIYEEGALVGFSAKLNQVNITHPNYQSCLSYSNPEDRTCFFTNLLMELEDEPTNTIILEDNQIFLLENNDLLELEQNEDFLYLLENDDDILISEDGNFLVQEDYNLLEDYILNEDGGILLSEDIIDWEAYDNFLIEWSNILGAIITSKGITA